MIAERDRIAAMVGRLQDFERECRNEAVDALSEAVEIPAGGLDKSKRFKRLALSQSWLDRARLLRNAVAILREDPCGCGTGADYRFDPDCLHHRGLRAAALARLQSTEPTP